MVKPANIISISYYYNEANLTPAYTARQCMEFAKLGLMGITVLFSSGDNGVAGIINACLNSDGSQSANGQLFNPSFPGTCPYVTSVGATQGTQFSFVSACLFIGLL
jgi:tripeptidyl-peptidase I